MATYEDLRKANEQIKTTDIKGKEYAEVNQRIKAFRMVYPEGFIRTDMISNEGGVCVFRAEAGIYVADSDGFHNHQLLGTGTAYEKEDSSFINKTSYIENCETSAIGRCLATLGFGIDTSVASYEEVETAVANQPIDDRKKKLIIEMAEKFGKNISDICKAYKIDRIDDMTSPQYADCLMQFKKIEDKK